MSRSSSRGRGPFPAGLVAATANESEVQLRALEREARAEREQLESYLTRYREAVTREISFLASVGIVAAARRRLDILDVERLSGLVRTAIGDTSR